MDFGFWWDIATYGNENWKGGFTPREVAENAYEYLCEWEATVSECEITWNINELLHLLDEDYRNGSDKALELSNTICEALIELGIKWLIY